MLKNIFKRLGGNGDRPEAPLPQAPSTGEVFVMRPYADMELHSYSVADPRKSWETLKATITRCGAEVRLLPALYNGDSRSPIFVRDTGIADAGKLLLYPDTAISWDLKEELESLRWFAKADPDRLPQPRDVPGVLEGGNVVSHPVRQMYFVGITHDEAQGYLHAFGFTQNFSSGEERTKIYNREKRYHAPFYLKANKALASETQKKVIPLYVKPEYANEFFHLDGALGVLPTGQAVVCKEVFSRTALAALETYIGRENMIGISLDDARRGATNFITVGGYVITNYASAALKETLAEIGYRAVDPTAVGLEPGAWMFGPMGAVRCATLKLTEDRGFPAPQPERARGV